GTHDVRRRLLSHARRAVRTQAGADAAADLDRRRRRKSHAADRGAARRRLERAVHPARGMGTQGRRLGRALRTTRTRPFRDPDVEVYRRWIERGAGPALELGCGNGRLLIGYARAGFDVEGVDSSADMLAICAAHGREAGLDLTLHHADWLALDLGRTYATIYNPAGSFALVAGDEDARTAL